MSSEAGEEYVRQTSARPGTLLIPQAQIGAGDANQGLQARSNDQILDEAMTCKTTTMKAKQAPPKKRAAKRKPAKKLAKPTLVGGKPPKPRTPQISKDGSMATKQDRGTKRTCQNSECGSRFYDLNLTPIACPICGAAYVVASSRAPITVVQPEEPAPPKPKKKEFAQAEADEGETAEEDTLDEATTYAAPPIRTGLRTFCST